MRKLLILLVLNSGIGLSNELPLYLVGVAGDVGVFQYKNKTTFVKVGERLPTGENLLDFNRFSVMTNKGEKSIERIKDYDKEIKEFFSIVDDGIDEVIESKTPLLKIGCYIYPANEDLVIRISSIFTTKLTYSSFNLIENKILLKDRTVTSDKLDHLTDEMIVDCPQFN